MNFTILGASKNIFSSIIKQYQYLLYVGVFFIQNTQMCFNSHQWRKMVKKEWSS